MCGHEPHPDHRQYAAYTAYRLKISLIKLIYQILKFSPIALLHASLLLLRFLNIVK